MATVEISDVRNPLPSTRQREVYYKAWFVTLSPNLRFPTGQEEDLDDFCTAFQQAIAEVLNHPVKMEDTLVINKRVQDRTVDSALSQFVVERGPERGIIHAHGIIRLKSHIKSLMVSYRAFPAAILRELKIKCGERGLRMPTNLYADFDPLDALAQSLNAQERILQYIHKNRQEPNLDHASIVGERKARVKAKKKDLNEILFTKPEQPQQRVEQIRQAQRILEEKDPELKNGLEYPYRYYNDDPENLPESDEEENHFDLDTESDMDTDKDTPSPAREEIPPTIPRSAPIPIPQPSSSSKVAFVQLRVPKLD